MVNAKLIAGLITISILGILIWSGPAKALLLTLTTPNTNVVVGEQIIFTASTKLDMVDVNITSFSLDLSGPISISCSFLPDGTKITSCNGMTIELIEKNDYGYGYGNVKNYTFKITLDTTNYPLGTYTTKLYALSGSQVFSTDGETITINGEAVQMDSCSIRARGGDLNVDEEEFRTDRNKLSFTVTNKKAVPGDGTLTSQKSRTTFSYKFEIVKVLSNNPANSIISVKGEYKTDLKEKISENAVIYLDKINKKVSVIGTDIEAVDMDITFYKGCS